MSQNNTDAVKFKVMSQSDVATSETSSHAMILLETVSLSTETEAQSAFLTCRVNVACSAQRTATALFSLLWPVTHCIQLHIWTWPFPCLLPGWLGCPLLINGQSPMLVVDVGIHKNERRAHTRLEMSTFHDLLRWCAVWFDSCGLCTAPSSHRWS